MPRKKGYKKMVVVRRGQRPYHEKARGLHFVGYKIGSKKYPQAVYCDATWEEENLKFKKLIEELDL